MKLKKINNWFLTYCFLLFFPLYFFSQNQLKGKNIYYLGDSITYGVGARGQQSFATLVASWLGMNSINLGVAGTTMMQQEPSCLASCKSAEFKVDNNQIPIYNSQTDGLIFISYLTNDVGINLPNYTIENYGNAIDKVIQDLYSKGWNKDNIKFNVRYYIEIEGLNKYPGSIYGNFKPATIERYNSFAELLRNKLDEQGIQYFDHYEHLSRVENPSSHIPDKVHPDALFYQLIAKYIVSNISFGTNLNSSKFELNESFTEVEYYNLLGQKIIEPKGITIVKAKKNGVVYSKKIFVK